MRFDRILIGAMAMRIIVLTEKLKKDIGEGKYGADSPLSTNRGQSGFGRDLGKSAAAG